MPKGFSQIAQAAKKIEEKTLKYEDFGPPVFFLKLPGDGDTAQVRFLEQGEDVYGYWYHDFSHINGQSGWKTKIPCLDQDDENVPCPGCREDLPRKFEGLVNVIWRNAPVYKRDNEGKLAKENDEYVVTGHDDQVAVWRGGINLFNKTLKSKDLTYRGLGTRDFIVTREGLKLKTTYSVEPADPDSGPVELSDEDKKLAENKYDLRKVARFVDEEKFDKLIESNLVSVSRDDYVPNNVTEITEFLNDSPFKESE